MKKSTKILTVILTLVLICSFGLHAFADGYGDPSEGELGLPFALSIPFSHVSSGSNYDNFWYDLPSVPSSYIDTSLGLYYNQSIHAVRNSLGVDIELGDLLTVSLTNNNSGQLFQDILLKPSILVPDSQFGLSAMYLEQDELISYTGYAILNFNYFLLGMENDVVSISELNSTSITSTYVDDVFLFDLSSLGIQEGNLAVVVDGTLGFRFNPAPTDWLYLRFAGTPSPTSDNLVHLLPLLSSHGTDLTIFEQFTAFLEDFSEIFADIALSAVSIFYNDGFTAIGIITLSIAGFALCVFIFRTIRNFLSFGG